MARPVHKVTTKEKIETLERRIAALNLDSLAADDISDEAARRWKKARKLGRAKKALEYHLKPHAATA